LAFEPLRQQLQEIVTKRLNPSASNVTELAAALVDQEERASQAGRLAELGTVASAVAHEVRNPLGVLSADVRGLEKAGVDSEVLDSMRDQIGRAEAFVEDLLRYGRPRPLEIRSVDLAALVELALSTATTGLGEPEPNVVVERLGLDQPVQVEADQAQLLDVLVVLFENALLELDGAPDGCIRVSCEIETDRLRLSIADNGRGVSSEIRDRIFEPFVTGRKRGGRKGGTGLGLAIARNIVERHGGSVRVADAETGGARFDIDLPLVQKVMGAARGLE
jgi:signal transduction histidine kinase